MSYERYDKITNKGYKTTYGSYNKRLIKHIITRSYVNKECKIAIVIIPNVDVDSLFLLHTVISLYVTFVLNLIDLKEGPH